MKTSNRVRIVLWVSPEVKQLLTDSATKEDRPLTKWATRTLLTAAGLPLTSASGAAKPLPVLAPTVVAPVLPVVPLVPPKALSVAPVGPVLPPLPDMTGLTQAECQEVRATHHTECMAIKDAFKRSSLGVS